MNVVDLFAGGGGASQGIVEALGVGPAVAINHREQRVPARRQGAGRRAVRPRAGPGGRVTHPALFAAEPTPPGPPPGSSAVLSVDGTHRYRLDRRVVVDEPDGPACLWVMLNPSTADAFRPDPTITRVIGFSRAWGHSRLIVCNLHALRGTDPSCLDAIEDHAEAYGDEYLEAAAAEASQIVVGWGAHGSRWPRRVRFVTELLRGRPLRRDVWCLGTTASGQPRHPLYLRSTTLPVRWAP